VWAGCFIRKGNGRRDAASEERQPEKEPTPHYYTGSDGSNPGPGDHWRDREERRRAAKRGNLGESFIAESVVAEQVPDVG
jgi:hypothetical protein